MRKSQRRKSACALIDLSPAVALPHTVRRDFARKGPGVGSGPCAPGYIRPDELRLKSKWVNLFRQGSSEECATMWNRSQKDGLKVSSAYLLRKSWMQYWKTMSL